MVRAEISPKNRAKIAPSLWITGRAARNASQMPAQCSKQCPEHDVRWTGVGRPQDRLTKRPFGDGNVKAKRPIQGPFLLGATST